MSLSELGDQTRLNSVSPSLMPKPPGGAGPTRSVVISYWYEGPASVPVLVRGRKLMKMGTAAELACALHAAMPCGTYAPVNVVCACGPTMSCTRSV